MTGPGRWMAGGIKTNSDRSGGSANAAPAWRGMQNNSEQLGRQPATTFWKGRQEQGETPIFPKPTPTLRQSLPLAFQIAIQRGRGRMPRIRGVRPRPHFEDFLNPRGGAVAEPSDQSEFDSTTLFLHPLSNAAGRLLDAGRREGLFQPQGTQRARTCGRGAGGKSTRTGRKPLRGQERLGGGGLGRQFGQPGTICLRTSGGQLRPIDGMGIAWALGERREKGPDGG